MADDVIARVQMEVDFAGYHPDDACSIKVRDLRALLAVAEAARAYLAAHDGSGGPHTGVFQKRDARFALEDADAATAAPTVLPDGSACAVVEMPLPPDHWLYTPGENAPPMPMRTAAGPARDALVEHVRVAARYAVRASTGRGTWSSFDPDALVQNMVVGLLGDWADAAAAPDRPSAQADA